MKNRYRFSLFGEPLGLCFDIVAGSEQEAADIAYVALSELIEGVDAGDFEELGGMRIYLNTVPAKKELRHAIVETTPVEEV